MLKAFMASALILASTLTMSAPVAAQTLIQGSNFTTSAAVTAKTQQSVQGESYQVAHHRGVSRAYVCTRDRYGYLNLRSGPSLRNRIIGRINNRQYLTILRSSGNWYKVRYRGRIGWVSRDFVCRGNLYQTPQSNSRNKTRLTMYIATDYQRFKTKIVYVSATRPITDVVGKLLKQGILPNRVRLIDYKVTVRNRVATINFITARNSRSIASAASTPSFILYGSLEKTLTENSQLNIDKVVIFEDGVNPQEQ